MKHTIKSIWSLFFGVLLLTMCSGMQGTLLGLRAASENFSVAMVGLIMSGYYMGFVVGSRFVPRWLGAVGHVRVFAALASLASMSILVHGVWVIAPLWVVLRMLTGFCFAGLYIVSESWLNDITTNETRGRLLSWYMVTVAAGFMGGQALISIASPNGYELFILASVLISFALVPMLLTSVPTPNIEFAERIYLKSLAKAAPLGFVGVFIHGIGAGALLWLTAVYTNKLGFSVGQTAILVGMIMFGGLVFQIPIGWLSDKQDRRHTILYITLLTIVFALFVPIAASTHNIGLLALALCLMGGMVLPAYSVCGSHVNDLVRSEQILATSGALILMNGLGGILGPLLGSLAMLLLGANGLFYFIAVVYGCMAAFSIVRIVIKTPMVIEDQSPAAAMALPTSQMVTAEALEEADFNTE